MNVKYVKFCLSILNYAENNYCKIKLKNKHERLSVDSF
ncbi:putative ORfan [Saudi moumouvirus]|nr:putative ORfan [Saudi moumouvirus]